MLMKPTDFARIRTFLAVAETLNFSKAADELGITSSAASQTVRALESDLGQQLFQRTTRTVVLTEAGTMLRDRMQPAVAEMEMALTQIRDAAGRPAGTVRIVSFRSAGEKFILPALADLRRNYPEIRLDITFDDEVTDPVAAGFDIAVRIGEVISQDMIAVPLGGDLRQIAVASRDYIARHSAPETPRDLLSHNCVCWRWPGQQHPFPWEFFEDGRWVSISPPAGIVVNDRRAALQLAIDGLGITFCIEDTVTELIEAGKLVPLLLEWSKPFPGFFVSYSRQRHMAVATRVVINKIRAGNP